jgi:predicted nicotinamide N-methyase
MTTLALSIAESKDASLSTGGNVWGAARAGLHLLDDLSARGWLRGRRVLGLGSGTGLLEIAAAALGASVLATDLPAVLPLLRENAARNAGAVAAGGGRLAVTALAWGEALPADVSDAGPFDVILASDVVFWPELFAPLVATLAALSADARAPAPHVFLVLEARTRRELLFFDALERAGFAWAKVDELHSAHLAPLVSGASAVWWVQRREAPRSARADDELSASGQ